MYSGLIWTTSSWLTLGEKTFNAFSALMGCSLALSLTLISDVLLHLIRWRQNVLHVVIQDEQPMSPWPRVTCSLRARHMLLQVRFLFFSYTRYAIIRESAGISPPSAAVGMRHVKGTNNQIHKVNLRSILHYLHAKHISIIWHQCWQEENVISLFFYNYSECHFERSVWDATFLLIRIRKSKGAKGVTHLIYHSPAYRLTAINQKAYVGRCRNTCLRLDQTLFTWASRISE